MVESDVQIQLVRQLPRIRREEGEIRVVRAAVADDRVRTGSRELAGRVVQSRTEVRRAAGDAAVRVAGGQIGKEREGETRRGGRSETELRRHVQRAHSAVGEAALVVVAVDEAIAVAAMAGDPVERQRGADFPVVGDAIPYRAFELVEVIAHVLVLTRRGDVK